MGDALAGLFAVIGVLAALTQAHATGQGQELNVAIYGAVAALMESSMADCEIGGVLRERTGSVLPGVAPSNTYPTVDGPDIVIAANADAGFVRLCTVMTHQSSPPTIGSSPISHVPTAPKSSTRSSATGRARWSRLPCSPS